MTGSKWAAAHVLAVTALAIAAFSPRPGVTWDEPGYVNQGVQYVHWIRRFLNGASGGQDPVWTLAPPDHPPLGKLAYGLAAVSPPRGMSPLAAARGVSIVLFALLVWLTVYAAHRAFGERVAWLAGAGLLLTPQVIAHSQFAALDLPVSVTWIAAAAVSLAGPTGKRGAVSIGFLWGLALLTKVNGIFLAGPILLWGRRQRRVRWSDAALLSGVAVLVFWLGWPWLWNDTISRVSTYLLDKQVRWIVPSFYLGNVYDASYPPWHYPLVLTVATLPIVVLLGAIVGAWVLARRRGAAAAWLAIHLAFTLGLACLPGVPRYDGTRLFLPAFPFLAIVAGVGLDHLVRTIAPLHRAAPRFAAAVLVLGFGSAGLTLRSAAPVWLSAYSPLIGGADGAEALGLETTFWGDAATPELLSAIPSGATVGAVPMGIDYVRAVQAAGLLPEGTTAAPEDRCDVLIMVGRKSMLRGELRGRFESRSALAETRRGGVVLAKLVDCGEPSR